MTRLAPYVVAVGLGLLVWWAFTSALEREGALREQAKALEARNARLEEEAGRIDTVYQTKRDTLVRVRRVTDSILLTDTVYTRDSVTQIVKGERLACDAVLQSCTERVAIRDSRIAVLDSLLTVERKRRPGWVSRTFGCTVGIDARIRPNAVCGVRFP